MIGSLGLLEILGIVLVVLLLFGAKRIPALGRGLGEGISNFWQGIRGRSQDERDLTNPSPRSENRLPPP
jgi:sec-independent protein translocase protein TatA